mmetsp:Transcript_23611/g.36317  ORF Transcript_23611/g.36317 Transcript_23611/m.36317 type:complete len:347 (-) Transcript_23611:40-1080(-)
MGEENVGIAFALVIGAGAATAVGAAVVFVPSLARLASRRVLAGSLGISAGVMTFISFVGIFQKSIGRFQDAGHSKENAFLYTTLCFFGGVLFMVCVDMAVKSLGHEHGKDDHVIAAPQAYQSGQENQENGPSQDQVSSHSPGCATCSDDPIGDLNAIQGMAETMIATQDRNRSSVTNEDNDGLSKDQNAPPTENQKLVRMGLNTALAIGLHNFPEGLATFVATLDDPKVGFILAVAIAIHNIPEGLCVAMPIYYATGNRMKAFFWALISGASEPLAALLGWAVLANSFSDELYAILFGLVAGMMVIIGTRDLLPTAHRYDPEDTVVTFSFIVGMVTIALSMVLFKL